MEIRKLLVANRGEIAARIFRACTDAGIATVAVAAPDDRGALHTRLAGETVEIESYLFSEEHIRAAKAAGVALRHGIYAGVAGPQLETSAERRFLRASGADDGLTFGTNNHAGVCVHFHDRIKRVVGFRDHSALTVTVADVAK